MERPQLGAQVLQVTKGAPRGAVVLCHGFGAPGDDLVGLHAELVERQPSLADVRFYFPQGPLSLGGVGWGDSRAWWMIDARTLSRLSTNDPAGLREFRNVEPEGMARARALLTDFVAWVRADSGVGAERLVLGGFSQGAMITTDVALRLDPGPAGLVIMSGTLLVETQWKALAAQKKGLSVVQSHGRQDPLLGFFAAEWLRDLLVGAGLALEFLPFEGGHTITLEVVEAVAAFLAARFTPARTPPAPTR